MLDTGIHLQHLYLKRNNMIKITLDEAYVFDLLAIYEVKMEKCEGEKLNKTIQSYTTLANEIKEQIGKDLYFEIIDSDTYQDLKAINKAVFELVDRASETQLSQDTASANYKRYILKHRIQSEFFNSILQEVKVL